MELKITEEWLEEMQGVNPLTVNPDTLVDIRDITIDTTLPKLEKMKSYIEQIKNPYCYKYGKLVVKVKYSDNGVTLEDKLKMHLKSCI